MRRILILWMAAVFAVAAPFPHAYAQQQNVPHIDNQAFQIWLKDFRTQAAAKGISQATLKSALTNIQPIARVIELDRRQPEFTWTFRDYMNKMVNTQRVAKAKRILAKDSKLLGQIGRKYGIQPRYLVAFWGLETDFGRLAKGSFPTIAALSTLAFDGRRSAFFRTQLLAALKIIDQGNITAAHMTGSWAGAMGYFQFIPTTFAAYAQDWNGDGKKDIWSNIGDANASAANFLTSSGWKNGDIWGREVKLPSGFNFNLVGLKTKKTLSAWQALGVRRTNGRALPKVDMKASLIVPAGAQGPVFLVYKNFRTILVWNRSLFYALAIGSLADRMVGLPAFTTLGPKGGRGLTHTESQELQRRLSKQGFDTGGVDGVVGPKSRGAIRNFQRAAGLVPDGYPSTALLARVRKGL